MVGRIYIRKVSRGGAFIFICKMIITDTSVSAGRITSLSAHLNFRKGNSVLLLGLWSHTPPFQIFSQGKIKFFFVVSCLSSSSLQIRMKKQINFLVLSFLDLGVVKFFKINDFSAVLIA